jgi:Secretion system C-terminal sorting domain
LGSCNIRFNYNNDGLTLVPSATQSSTLVTNLLNAQYSTPTVTKLGTAPAQYGSVNFTISSANTPLTVTSAGLDIVRIKFAITNPALFAGLKWRISDASYTCDAPTASAANTALVKKLEMAVATTINADPAITTAGNLVSAPLPITLKSFIAIENGNTNEVRWTTEVESNLRNYVVEKSKDGKNWTNLGTMMPKTSKNYDMTDATPYPVTYYRLRTLENDGREELSNVVVVNRGGKFSILEVSPNPTSRDIKAQFESAEAGEVSVQVLDMVGRTHSTLELDVTKGTNLIDVSTSALPAGVYFLSINNGTTTLTQRFVKQ